MKMKVPSGIECYAINSKRKQKYSIIKRRKQRLTEILELIIKQCLNIEGFADFGTPKIKSFTHQLLQRVNCPLFYCIKSIC